MSEHKIKWQEVKDQQDTILERMAEGTQAISPEYFNEAILGFSFNAWGKTALCYSAELCLDLIKRNQGLDTEAASAQLAELALQFEPSTAPVFVWGLD
ncbi:MAG: hypothetical protein WCD45_04050 [Gallionella sp.]